MTAGPAAAPGAVGSGPPRVLARRAIVGVVTGFYLASVLANLLPAGPTHAVAGAGAVVGLALGVVTARHPRLSKPLLGAALGALTGYVAQPAYPVLSVLNDHSFFARASFDYGYGPASWMLLGAGAGAALAAAAERGSRVASPLLGVALGGLAGHLAEVACRTSDASVDHRYGLGPPADAAAPAALLDGYGRPEWVIAGSLFGLALGLLAHHLPRWRTASLGLAFGVVAGSLGCTASRVSYATFDPVGGLLGSGFAGRLHGSGFAGDTVAGYSPEIWIATAAVIGLLLGVLAAGVPSFRAPCSGLAIGGLVGYVVCSPMRSPHTFGTDAVFTEPASQAGSTLQVVVSGQGPVAGMAAGAAFGLCLGLHAVLRFRLAASGFGLAVGTAAGIAVASAYWDIRFLQAAPLMPAGDYVPTAILVTAMVLGTVLGLLADRRPRLARPLTGLALGVAVGYVATNVATALSRLADHADQQRLTDGRVAVVGMAVGAAVGLLLGLRADPPARGVTTVSGLALGLLGGAAASQAAQYLILEPRNRYEAAYVYLQVGLCGGGAVVGMVLGAFTHRHPLRGRPCLGALAGAFLGSTMWFLYPGTPQAETVVVSAVVGAVAIARRPSAGWGLVPAGGGVRGAALSVRYLAGAWRPGACANGLVGAAAALAVDGQRQERYAEEFRATLAEITGPLACPRRIWCALTIFANAARLRAELDRAASADQPSNPADGVDDGY